MAEGLLITIRCAHQSYKDANLEIQLDWTVENLKCHLHDVYPSKPDAKKQRLIFAGQLMKDKELLSKYFKRNATDHLPIVHLVCAPSVEQLCAGTSGSVLRQRKIQTPQPNATTANQDAPTATATASPSPQQQPGNFYQAQTPQMQYFSGGYFPQPTVDPAWQQTQQMYNAYMVQYMQYLQQLYGTVYWPCAVGSSMLDTVVTPPTATGVPVQPGVPPVVPNVDQAPNGPQGPGVQPQQQPGAMNAQGGLDDEDDARNRDWLDWLYMGCRAALLFTILYFYSSMERFTFVMFCCLLIYGLQAGWFGRRRNNNNNNNGQNNNEPVNNNANNPPAAEQDGNPAEQAAVPPPADPAEPQTAWNVFWSTCWTFISSFFASLVPQRPPPMNLN